MPTGKSFPTCPDPSSSHPLTTCRVHPYYLQTIDKTYIMASHDPIRLTADFFNTVNGSVTAGGL